MKTHHRMGSRTLWIVCTVIAVLVLSIACRITAEPPGSRPTSAPAEQESTTPSPTPTATPAPTTATRTPTPSPTATPTPTPTETPQMTNTPSPTSTPIPPTHTDTPTPPPEPEILFFKVTPNETDPGETVTLTWSTRGYTKAIIYRLLQSGQFPEEGIDVPVSGSLTYTIDPDAKNWVNFLLYVKGPGGASENVGATVILRCQHTWFFAPPPDVNVCPTAPLRSWAAEQHFERGRMIWIEAEDGIYVLFDDEQYTTDWTWFPDEWDEGDPERDPSLEPPPGLQQPIRGFGLVWRSHPIVRERLGWAVEGEQGYNTTLQRTTRYKYNATYIKAADGNVWYLHPEQSAWEKLDPQRVE